jgi:hypothetical protein
MPLTQDEPCILLHVVEPGGKLMDVASGTAMPGRIMHHRNIAEDLMKFKLAMVVPEYRDILPPHQPPGAEEDDVMVLGNCTGWLMTWPKNQIRLGRGLPSVRCNIGATSPIIRPKIVRPRAAATLKEPAVAAATTLKEPAVAAATTLKEPAVAAATTLKEPVVAAATRKEPAIAATTTRHQQLLGKLPQRPSTKRNVRQAAASQPPPPNFQDMAPLGGNDDDDDIDAYINTGACSQDIYMPRMDEEAFRTHGDQLGRPTTVTQRLTFTGFSLQDTPPEAGNPAQVKPATIF